MKCVILKDNKSDKVYMVNVLFRKDKDITIFSENKSTHIYLIHVIYYKLFSSEVPHDNFSIMICDSVDTNIVTDIIVDISNYNPLKLFPTNNGIMHEINNSEVVLKVKLYTKLSEENNILLYTPLNIKFKSEQQFHIIVNKESIDTFIHDNILNAIFYKYRYSLSKNNYYNNEYIYTDYKYSKSNITDLDLSHTGEDYDTDTDYDIENFDHYGEYRIHQQYNML